MYKSQAGELVARQDTLFDLLPAKVRVSLVREPGSPVEYPTIHNVHHAYNLLAPMVADSPREILAALYLNHRNETIAVHEVSVGIIDCAFMDPREIFRAAILCNASSFILAHNHPSGCAEPSPEDITMTEKIEKCGELMGIKILDHLIVGAYGQFVSLAGRGLI